MVQASDLKSFIEICLKIAAMPFQELAQLELPYNYPYIDPLQNQAC